MVINSLKARLSLAVAASLTVAALAATAPHASSKDSAKRHNVLDYFFLLSAIGLSGYEGKQRRELLKAPYEPVIDLPNDYMSVNPDSSPREQIAVFRYKGAELVAQSAPDYQSDYNGFSLYRLRNGQLRDVTEKELPVPVRQNQYLYELPRIGTTIRVYKFDLSKQKRWHAFDLKWRGGRFVKAALR